ncbi:AsmA family protein [Oricola sp.]|uniref:AsmA family protein n=1 Tax=Oricola sp. TaxID=1979950 RepID=UPI003BA90565
MAQRAARVAFWIAALCIAAIIGIWALLPWLVSSEVVRTAIERELSDIAGQTVQVDGRVDIRLYPAPIARLYDLRVPRETDAAGEERPDLLTADMVEVAIPFSSLVMRNPVFSQFRLVRPYLRIALDERASPIGRDGRLALAIADIERDDPQAAGQRGSAVGLGTFTIENGTIEFLDFGEENPEKITELTGTISWPRFAGRMSATLDAIWRGAAFQQSTDIDEAILFFAGRAAQVRTEFTSEVLNYAFDGAMSTGETPFAEGPVSISSPSLSQALNWLQAGIQPGRSIGEISLEGDMRGDNRRIRFDSADMVLQGSAGTGVLEFAFGAGEKPSLTATLDFLDLDVPSYLSAFTGFPRNLAAFGDTASTTFIDQIDVDLRLSAARASAGNMALANVAAVTQIRNGEAVFEMADAAGYGGFAQARFALGRDEDQVRFDLRINADRIDSAALAGTLEIEGLVPKGELSGMIEIGAPLAKWSDIFNRADGEIKLDMTDGRIDGFTRETLFGTTTDQRFFRLQEAGAADLFDTMHVSARVQDGVIIIEDGSIAYPDFSVRLNGVIPYSTASVALTTIASERTTEDEPASPVVQHFIGGSWANPYATPVLLP